MTSKLSNASVFAILIAAAVHDVGHQQEITNSCHHRAPFIKSFRSICFRKLSYCKVHGIDGNRKMVAFGGFSKVDARY